MKRLNNLSLKMFKIITTQINKKISSNNPKIKIINNKNLKFLNQHNSLDNSHNKNSLNRIKFNKNSLNKNKFNKNSLNRIKFKSHNNLNHNHNNQ